MGLLGVSSKALKHHLSHHQETLPRTSFRRPDRLPRQLPSYSNLTELKESTMRLRNDFPGGNNGSAIEEPLAPKCRPGVGSAMARLSTFQVEYFR